MGPLPTGSRISPGRGPRLLLDVRERVDQLGDLVSQADQDHHDTFYVDDGAGLRGVSMLTRLVPAAVLTLAFLASLASVPGVRAGAQAWAWSSSARFGEHSADGYSWDNNAWGPGPGPQVISVNSPGDWQVASDQAWGRGVESFPEIWSNPDGYVDSFPGIVGTDTESSPSGPGEYNEALYDIRLNAPRRNVNSGGTEVMIWTDVHIAVGAHYAGSYDIYGTRYRYYDSPGHWFLFIREANAPHAVTHIKAILDWLGAHGGPVNPYLSAVDFGWEIWGTRGTRAFTVSQYSLRLSG